MPTKTTYEREELEGAIKFLERTYDTIVLEKVWVNRLPSETRNETCVLFAMPAASSPWYAQDTAYELLREVIFKGRVESFMSWNDSRKREEEVTKALEDAIDLARAILETL